MSLSATNPYVNATVFASAGTGKTWLLVARLTRLLLAGAKPGSILAVTFTKKAAGEMQERLQERLAQFAICPEDELIAALQEIGETQINERLIRTARGLYEQLLDATQPVRTTTFHSFCHDLLSRFPLQADIPPGYELVENTAELKELAWEDFIQKVSADPESELQHAFWELVDTAGSMESARSALDSFLNARADWWAYTENQEQPLSWAMAQLESLFECSESDSPEAAIDNDIWRQNIGRYAELLRAPKAPKGNIDRALSILEALNNPADADLIESLKTGVLTKDSAARKLTASKAYRAANGEDVAEELLTLHDEIASRLASVVDHQNRIKNMSTNRSWYITGTAYLEAYQAQKLQQGQLDFADMEWQAYRLLNSREDTQWVQFKLDERIDHLLIDEFQDTNPTQWRLLFPLLQEFANFEKDHRSVFLVGDTKQSIYGFRRANPKLQETASRWLQEHLRSQPSSMDKSRRSASAIMQATNSVFASDDFKVRIGGFHDHDTFHQDLWGRVEIHPAFEIPPEEKADSEDRPPMRDPLTTPRPEKPSAKTLEANFIAQRIEALMDDGTMVGHEGDARPLEYGDIKILLRSRTAAPEIEKALRNHRIPFIGTSRGMLLPRLEIQDIRVLLRLLHSPQDNLALAQVLKSPIFGASDEDLITLARTPGEHWFQRLESVAPSLPKSAPLHRALRLLTGWHELAPQLPLHDLLETIYFEGNVLNRYSAACRDWQRPQVVSNLQQLIRLALDIDSGRYPSLSHFLMRLEELENASDGAPDEPQPDNNANAVQIHTIHDSKGLEAPVVFYADLASKEQSDKAWSTIVDWPAEEDRPRSLLAQQKQAFMDSVSQGIIDQRKATQEREKANLVYVALTRARQMLILSASKNRASSKLYDQLKSALEPVMQTDENGVLYLESGQRPAFAPAPAADAEEAVEIPEHLKHPPQWKAQKQERSPSRMEGETTTVDGVETDPTGRDRGTVIHALLEQLSLHPDHSHDAILYRVGADHNLLPDNPELQEWMAEAQQVIAQFPELFDAHIRAHSELPLTYLDGEQPVYGIIDRLVITDDCLTVVDYKTHRIQTQDQAVALGQQYRSQLSAYAKGLKKVWPDKTVKMQLLFTALPALVDLEMEQI